MAISNYHWSTLIDPASELQADSAKFGAILDKIAADSSVTIGEQDKAILNAAIRNPSGGFNSDSLYDSMTEEEYQLFLRKDGALVVDEKEYIKRAIARRTAELRRKLCRVVADDPGKADFYGE